MNLRQIRYFVVLAQEKNFTRAAERLHISQPPLSRQMQLLEEVLGTKLLDREKRPLALTEAGKIFYDQALQILSRIEQMKRATQQAAMSERRIFTIGFVPSMLYGELPLLVKRLKKLYPNLEFQLSEFLSSQQTEALRTGLIDVGFGRLRLNYPDISRRVLREERLLLVTPIDHILSKINNSFIPLNFLEKENVILYPNRHRPNYSDSIISLLRDYNLHLERVKDVSELQTALGLVAAGIGVSIIPASARGLRKDLKYNLLGDDRVTSPIILNYRSNENMEFIKVIVNILLDIYEEEHSWMEYSSHCLNKENLCFD